MTTDYLKYKDKITMQNRINKRPTFLVDFDGVWTDLSGQAAAVHEYRDSRLAQISGLDRSRIRGCMSEIRRVLERNPQQHGWRSLGRITAYSDEDPFLTHNSLVAGIELLAKQGYSNCAELYSILHEKGHSDTNALGSELFQEGCKLYLEASGHTLLPGARQALEDLLCVADVVFCTNFSTDAVVHTWGQYGMHPGETRWGGRLTIRGNARKQVLTEDPERTVEYSGRQVAVDRGYYLEALNEERPDVVVGDVFSLDLALPLYLKSTRDDFSGLACLLKRTPFTPGWSLSLCGDTNTPGLFMIESPTELKDIALGFVDEKGQ